MNQLWFWNKWSKTERIIFYILLFIGISSLIISLALVAFSADLAIDTQTIGKLVDVPFTKDSIAFGNLKIPFQSRALVVMQYYAGDKIFLNPWIVYGYVTCVALAITVAIAAISYLKGYWYFISIGIFVSFLVMLKLDSLLLYESTNNYALVAAIGIYLPISYYFSSIKTASSMQVRILLFLVGTIMFSCFIYFGSSVPYPFMHLATNSISATILVSIGFCILVAHEIIAAFFFMVTQANFRTGKSITANFILLTLIFLGNVLLVYLVNTGRIDWKIFYFNEFFLLALAGILGLWGLKSYLEQTEVHHHLWPVLLMLYLAVAITTFSTIAVIAHSYNDPILETMEDAIIYSQLCIGIIFAVYTIGNFSEIISARAKAYKVLYKPNRMPFFTARLAGSVLVLVLYFYNNKTPLYQAMAGIENATANLYDYLNKEDIANLYYRRATELNTYNHHSNYQLALSHENEDYLDARQYYENAIRKNPTALTFINFSNFSRRYDKFFESVFTLEEGLNLFPRNYKLLNNLGFAYSESSLTDSAEYFFNLAQKEAENGLIEQANLLALSTLTRNKSDLTDVGGSPIVKANKLAYQLIHHENIEVKPSDALNLSIPPDFGDIALFHNTLLSNTVEYELEQSIIDSIQFSYNWTGEYLYFALANYNHSNARLTAALRQLETLINSHRNKPFYHYFLAQVFFQIRDYRQAFEHFEYHYRITQRPTLEYALSTFKTGGESSAITLIDSLRKKDLLSSQLCISLKEIMANPAYGYALNLDEADRLNWVAIWSHKLDSGFAQTIMNSFENKELKAKAILSILENTDIGADDRLEILKAGRDLVNIPPTLATEIEISWLLANLDNIKSFSSELNDITPKNVFQEQKVNFIKLWLSHKKGENQTLTDAFNYYASINPYFEDAVIHSAAYLGQEDQLRTYTILQEAISVNAYSPTLLKAYILACARLNLNTFANEALTRLDVISGDNFYRKVKAEYDSLTKVYSQFVVF